MSFGNYYVSDILEGEVGEGNGRVGQGKEGGALFYNNGWPKVMPNWQVSETNNDISLIFVCF